MKAQQKMRSGTQVGRCSITRSAIKWKRQEEMKKQMKLFVIHDPKRYPTRTVPTVDVIAELMRKRLVIEAQQKKRAAPRKTTIKQQREFVKAKIKEQAKKEVVHPTVQKEYLSEDFSRLRGMTTRERENYDKMVEKSKGFNVGEIAEDIYMKRLIRPIWTEKSSEPPSELDEGYAMLGLADYNTNNKETQYQFVKLIRANMGWGNGNSSMVYYVTFQAKEVLPDMSGSSCQNFQARVRTFCPGRGRDIVEFCNLEPKSE